MTPCSCWVREHDHQAAPEIIYCASHRACFRAVAWLERAVLVAVAVAALVVITLASCTWTSIPVPGRLGDEGFRMPAYRWGSVPTPPEGGPRP